MTYNWDVDINIPENQEKGNPSTSYGFSVILKRIFTPVLIILVGIGGFGLGKLSKIEESRPPVTIESISTSTPPVLKETTSSTSKQVAVPETQKTGNYIAARGGTAYYLPWCAAAQKIAEKNKVWFNTKEDAERAGYKPAQNCRGL